MRLDHDDPYPHHWKPQGLISGLPPKPHFRSRRHRPPIMTSNPPPVNPPAPQVTNINHFKIDFRDKDRFSGSDYDIWEMRLQGIFEEHKLWGIVDGSIPEPAANHVDHPNWVKSDRKARNIILAVLDKTMMYHASSAFTSNAVWSRLKDLHKSTDSSHKMAITKQFHSMTMREGESVEKYIQHFRSVRARFASCGTLLTESEAAEAFLASLPSSYSAFVTAQTGLLDQSKAAQALGVGRVMSLSDVIAGLLAEELKRDSHCKPGSSSSGPSRALYSQRGKPRKFKKPYSPPSGTNASAEGPSKRKGSCNWCRIPGHFEKNCRKKLAGEPRRPAPAQANMSTAAKPTVLVFFPISLLCTQTSWYTQTFSGQRGNKPCNLPTRATRRF